MVIRTLTPQPQSRRHKVGNEDVCSCKLTRSSNRVSPNTGYSVRFIACGKPIAGQAKFPCGSPSPAMRLAPIDLQPASSACRLRTGVLFASLARKWTSCCGAIAAVNRWTACVPPPSNHGLNVWSRSFFPAIPYEPHFAIAALWPRGGAHSAAALGPGEAMSPGTGRGRSRRGAHVPGAIAADRAIF